MSECVKTSILLTIVGLRWWTVMFISLLNKINIGTDVYFYRPLVMKHASQSSVEDRIKRNVYNIQRTHAALDTNFARH